MQSLLPLPTWAGEPLPLSLSADLSLATPKAALKDFRAENSLGLNAPLEAASPCALRHPCTLCQSSGCLKDPPPSPQGAGSRLGHLDGCWVIQAEEGPGIPAW